VAKLPGAVHLPGRVLFLAEDPQLVRDQLDGKDLDWRPGIKLRDDISPDEITPAYICYYYDDTLGDFPYLGLKCGEEFPVTRGSVKRGGFTASFSGKRRGKGSSREQSPYAEMCAGIKLVVAENIERIYRENCQNLGLLTTTDFSILDRVRSGEAIPLNAFTAGEGEITRGIIEYGGLFNFNVARLQGQVALSPPGTAPRPMTLAKRSSRGTGSSIRPRARSAFRRCGPATRGLWSPISGSATSTSPRWRRSSSSSSWGRTRRSTIRARSSCSATTSRSWARR